MKELTYQQRYSITQPLLKQEFKVFEELAKSYNFSKKDMLWLVQEIISSETHGMTSYLTPSISKEVLEYLEKDYQLDFSTSKDIYFEVIALTDNQIIKWLLTKDFDINTQDEEGNTLLHLASKIRYTQAYSFNASDFVPKPWELPNSDDPEKVETILAFNPNPFIKNNQGETPLDVANRYKNYRVAHILSQFIQHSLTL